MQLVMSSRQTPRNLSGYFHVSANLIKQKGDHIVVCAHSVAVAVAKKLNLAPVALRHVSPYMALRSTRIL